jgi:hypothetical protein
MKTGTNYNQHEGLGNEKYIPRHVDNRRLLNAAIGASGFEPVEKMRSEVVERRTKRRRNTHAHDAHKWHCLSHIHKTRLLAVDEICTQDHTSCCGWNLHTRLHFVRWMNEILHINCTWPWSGWDPHGIWALLKSGGCDLWTSFNFNLDECWMLDVPNDLVHYKMCLLLENETMLVSQMQPNYHSSCIQGRIWMNVSISTYEISFIITSVVGKKKN